MTRRIDTEILIQASSERVWAVLTDFAAYPEWNPFIVSLEGKAEWGEHQAELSSWERRATLDC